MRNYLLNSFNFFIFTAHSRILKNDSIPNKCVHLMLQQLFFGVSIETEKANADNFQSEVTVNYRFRFLAKNKPTQVRAKNCAAQEALIELCDIENKFLHKQHCNHFENEFGDKIQKYN